MSLFTECVNFPDAVIAFDAVAIAAGTSWLTVQSDGTVTLSQGVTVTFGGVFDLGDIVVSQVTATGTKTWTYKNEFQITENAEGVTVVYYGNISVSTALPLNSKDIAIMSYAGNINTTALTATNITLMAQKGTVTTGAVTTNNFVVFNDGSTFDLPVGSSVNGDLLINQTLRFPDDFPAANTTNNLSIASLSMSGDTCTLSISGGGVLLLRLQVKSNLLIMVMESLSMIIIRLLLAILGI